MTLSKGADSFFEYKGYSIPERLVNMTGGGPDSFDEISQGHMRNIGSSIGLRPGLRVLEVGCGIGRDAIPLTEIIGSTGTYLGVDIIKESIDWCTANIGAKHPNFKFHHVDVKDQLHNPGGITATQQFKFPIENGTIDLIILQSVFTHMFEADIIHYMKEFNRVLTPEGRVYATCFVVDETVLKSARRTNHTRFDLLFNHYVGRGCYINNAEFPAGAVAFRRDALHRMIHQSELLLVNDFLKGSWSGCHGAEASDGPDVMILKKLTPAIPLSELYAAKLAYLKAVEEALSSAEPYYAGEPLELKSPLQSIPITALLKKAVKKLTLGLID